MQGYYFTKRLKENSFVPMSYEELLRTDEATFDIDKYIAGKFRYHNIVTTQRQTLNENDIKYAPKSMKSAIESFLLRYGHLRQEDMSVHYGRFYLPKKSGGLRPIDEPKEELSEALSVLKNIFEYDFKALYHDCAYAYAKNRSTQDAIKVHQQNRSEWFLKLDFSNFFGSTTKEFVMQQLGRLYPFCVLIEHIARGKELLEQALDLCFLNGGLPQGTPISPMLTNLMMIPIDNHLFNYFHEDRMVYTRYADDLCISSAISFPYKNFELYIKKVLTKHSAPFIINERKTKYGSHAGSNWILGMMLNKENNITIGYQKKKRFKAMLFNYAMDKQNQSKVWTLQDLQIAMGIISYYKQVEEQYVVKEVTTINEKFNIDIIKLMKLDIKNYMTP